MKIYLGKTAGFCMGVSRAVSKAEELSKKGGVIYTYGPLIHNPQVIDDLKKKKVKVTESLKGLEGATLLIRTHGVSPKEKSLIRESVAEICDMTCPRVARVQAIIRKYAGLGYKVVIVGDADHPEVMGLMGFAGENGFVVHAEEDIKKIPLKSKLCIVSQTTMNTKLFEKLSRRLSKASKDSVVFNTICDSTSKRQDEVIELCRKVEAMIVIGGKNSANTTRLAEISMHAGIKTYHIETEKEINLREIGKYEKIGITAGASTPNWMIKRVLKKLGSVVTKD